METIRSFEPANRYKYDFGACTSGKGFAQIDTSQDASYYGTWANPFDLIIISYCEGDVTIQKTDIAKEFVDEIFKIKSWNDEYGHRFIGIDPGFNVELKNRFVELGLGEFLH